MIIKAYNHSGYKCATCDSHLHVQYRLIPGPGIFCTQCNAISTNLIPINLVKAYRNTPEGFGYYAPDKQVEEKPASSVSFPPELIKKLMETVEATHDPKNDPKLALEILLAFYRRYSSELYRLAEMLEGSEELSEGDETMIRLLYECKENYYEFKDTI